MKSLTRAIAIASLATVSAVAQAELSSTVGAVTDYVFRGEGLAGAGAYASVDFEEAGFYAGVWAINDGGAGANDGLETDYYFGYGFEQDELSLGLGYTRYEYSYTANFEHEINFSAGFAGFGLDVALGKADKNAFDSGIAKDDEQDYTVITLSYSTDTYGILVGSKDIDKSDEKLLGESEYKWVELSASKEVNGFDFTLLLGRQFDAESTSLATATPPNATTKSSSYGTEYLVLDVSKSFDL